MAICQSYGVFGVLRMLLDYENNATIQARATRILANLAHGSQEWNVAAEGCNLPYLSR